MEGTATGLAVSEAMDTKRVTAVDALRQRLKSKSASSCVVSVSRKDLQTDGFGSIFGGPPDPEIALSLRKIKKIRLLVFEAIGKCSTLEEVDLSEDQEFPINLTCEELQALLEPLKSSTSLVKLNLDGQAVLSTKSGARAVGQFVDKNRSCQHLSTRIPALVSGDNIDATERLTRWLNIFLKAGPEGATFSPLLKYWYGLGPQIPVPSAVEILCAFPKLRAMYWQPETLDLLQWQCPQDLDFSYIVRAKHLLEHTSLGLDSVSLIGRARGLAPVMDVFAEIRKQLRVFRIYCSDSEDGGYIEGISGLKYYYTLPFKEGYHGYSELSPEQSVTNGIPNFGEGQRDAMDGFSRRGDYNLGTNVVAVLSRSSELECVGLYRLRFTEEEWGMILRSLRSAPRLENFGCSCDLKLGFDEGCWNELTTLVQISSKLKILKLESSPKPGTRFQRGVCDILEAVKSNQGVERLVLNHFHMEESEVRALARLIEENNYVKELSLASCRFTESDLQELFGSLVRNVVLRKLDLSGVQGLTDQAFRGLTIALQGPSLIEEIEIQGTIWEQEGKKPMLQRALEEALRRQNYTHIMKRLLKGEEFMRPISGRLFLCGEPYSGKTQLRKSLMKLAAKTDSNHLTFKLAQGCGRSVHTDSKVQRLYRRFHPDERTKGVEIELCVIDGMQISIWDLAGQEIFRAVHDCLFPTFNTACVFLFVFSPFDIRTKQLKKTGIISEHLGDHLASALMIELRPWLKFIASKSQAGKELPPVKILVSHVDKLRTAGLDQILGWAERVTSAMRDQFKELLALDDRVIGADNTVLFKGVDTVLDRTREAFTDLLETERLACRVVPQTCCELMDALRSRKMAGEFQEASIVRSKDFFSFCEENASSLQKYQNDTETRELLMDAITEYLHDAGIILRFPRSGLVVVDPNWYTFSFLGHLIGRAQENQLPRVHVDGCSGGFITKADFQKLLLTLVEDFT